MPVGGHPAAPIRPTTGTLPGPSRGTTSPRFRRRNRDVINAYLEIELGDSVLMADWCYVCDFDHRMDDINLVAEPQRALVRADGVLVSDVHPVKANFAQPQPRRSGGTVRGEADVRPQRLTEATTQSVRTLRCTTVDSDYIDVDVWRDGLRADIAHLDNGEFGSAALSGRLSAFRRDSGRSA